MVINVSPMNRSQAGIVAGSDRYRLGHRGHRHPAANRGNKDGPQYNNSVQQSRYNK